MQMSYQYDQLNTYLDLKRHALLTSRFFDFAGLNPTKNWKEIPCGARGKRAAVINTGARYVRARRNK